MKDDNAQWISLYVWHWQLKFLYFEKATKFEELSLQKGFFFQFIVAISENLSFTTTTLFLE